MALGTDPGPVFRLFPKSLEKGAKKEAKNGAEIDAFLMIFLSFSRKCESAFRLRRRERIEVQAPDFLAPCLHFCFPFFSSFFTVFGPPRGPQFQGSAAQPAPP